MMSSFGKYVLVLSEKKRTNIIGQTGVELSWKKAVTRTASSIPPLRT